jgi:hypothetical protein
MMCFALPTPKFDLPLRERLRCLGALIAAMAWLGINKSFRRNPP